MGSGVLQVKAALADRPLAMNLRVALVKLVSTILALGSGLSLGHFMGIAAEASVGAESLIPYALVGMSAFFSATIRTPIAVTRRVDTIRSIRVQPHSCNERRTTGWYHHPY
jgi:H+/Cl- antiporter ClcA